MSDHIQVKKSEWETFIRENEQLIKRYDALTKRLKELEAHNTDLQRRLSERESFIRENDKLIKRYDALAKRSKELEAQNADLQGRLDAREIELTQLQKRMEIKEQDATMQAEVLGNMFNRCEALTKRLREQVASRVDLERRLSEREMELARLYQREKEKTEQRIRIRPYEIGRRICGRCGRILSVETRFCDQCGEKCSE